MRRSVRKSVLRGSLVTHPLVVLGGVRKSEEVCEEE